MTQLPLPFAHPASYARDTFLHGPGNAEALAWLARQDAWPERRLAVWGEAGSGKTHLLHVWVEETGGVLLRGAALRWPLELPGRWLAIDDASAAPADALLHLLNAAAESAVWLLVAGRAPPPAWFTSPADLVSRLRAAQAVELRGPRDDLLAPMLARLLAERQLAVPAPVQAWLLLRLPRSPAALADAAARLDRALLAGGGRLHRAMLAAVVDETAALWHGEAA